MRQQELNNTDMTTRDGQREGRRRMFRFLRMCEPQTTAQEKPNQSGVRHTDDRVDVGAVRNDGVDNVLETHLGR